jgi:hypothetical protein
MPYVDVFDCFALDSIDNHIHSFKRIVHNSFPWCKGWAESTQASRHYLRGITFCLGRTFHHNSDQLLKRLSLNRFRTLLDATLQPKEKSCEMNSGFKTKPLVSPSSTPASLPASPS